MYYKPRHVTDSCDCKAITIEPSNLERVIEKQQLPLLSIKNHDSIKIIEVEVKPSEGSLRYVAISHVWADGLGNPANNSLPRCQLQAIAHKVRTLEMISNSGTEAQEELLIWLDTLCCPTEAGKAKETALS